MKLDLGSGSRPREGFEGVDVAELPGILRFNLIDGSRWPWKDDSVDELSSSHFIEHIPADNVHVSKAAAPPHYVLIVEKDRLFFFFDEAFRVAKPGALFHVTWPSLKSTDAFRDPTHRRFLPIEFLHYLSREGRARMGIEHYEVNCNWVVTGDSHLHLEPAPIEQPGDLEALHYLRRMANRLWDVERAYSVTLKAEK